MLMEVINLVKPNNLHSLQYLPFPGSGSHSTHNQGVAIRSDSLSMCWVTNILGDLMRVKVTIWRPHSGMEVNIQGVRPLALLIANTPQIPSFIIKPPVQSTSLQLPSNTSPCIVTVPFSPLSTLFIPPVSHPGKRRTFSLIIKADIFKGCYTINTNMTVSSPEEYARKLQECRECFWLSFVWSITLFFRYKR
jgi:hypothetical protein